MKKRYKKIIYYTLAILFGIFMFIYGGYDDSPGAQLIGFLFFVFGVTGLVRNKKKNLE